MQIRIEFPAGPQSAVSKRTGKPYRFQEGYALTLTRDGKPHRYPLQFRIFVRDNDPGVAPGLYVLAPDAIDVRDGNLTIVPDRLLPVPAASTPESVKKAA